MPKGQVIEAKVGEIPVAVNLANMRKAHVNNFNGTGVIRVMKSIASQYPRNSTHYGREMRRRPGTTPA